MLVSTAGSEEEEGGWRGKGREVGGEGRKRGFSGSNSQS